MINNKQWSGVLQDPQYPKISIQCLSKDNMIKKNINNSINKKNHWSSLSTIHIHQYKNINYDTCTCNSKNKLYNILAIIQYIQLNI